MNLKDPASFCIVSHDAGGAEIISAWIKRNTQHRYDYLLAGPAVNIFNRKLNLNVKSKNAESFLEMIQQHQYDFLLTGTSWDSRLELDCLSIAKQHGLQSISFLDHWSEYDSRFKLSDGDVYPNEIWVADDYACALAKKLFGEISIQTIGNPYLDEIKIEYDALSAQKRKKPKKYNIVFLSEPISALAKKLYNDENYYEANESDCLNRFIAIAKEKFSFPVDLTIRPHPSENKQKYIPFLEQSSENFTIGLSSNANLLQDLIGADWVVGFDSMALVIALRCEKRVSSCLPKKSTFRTLPFDEIDYVFAKCKDNQIDSRIIE